MMFLTLIQVFSMVIVEHFEIIFDLTICKKYYLINYCNIVRDDSQECEYILTLNKVSYVIRSYYNCQVKFPPELGLSKKLIREKVPPNGI